MDLKDIRLLIVVEDADYRGHLAAGSLVWPPLNESPTVLSAVDSHLLSAANYWRSQLQEVAIFSLHSAAAYSTLTHSGIRLIGSGIIKAIARARAASGSRPLKRPLMSPQPKGEATRKQTVRLVADFCPTHIVMCTPAPAVLSWANRHHIPSVVLLSDWQEPLGLRARWQHNRLIAQLNRPSVNWIGSQGIHACKILQASGISPHKLIPWEWPQLELSKPHPPKQLRYSQDTIELVYAGPLSAAAGIYDLLLAIAYMQRKSIVVQLKLLCGPKLGGDLAVLQSRIQQLNLEEHIALIPWASELERLNYVRAADLMVIPGWDGRDSTAAPTAQQTLGSEIPGNIRLAVAARTPIVAASHPPLQSASAARHKRHDFSSGQRLFPDSPH